VRLEGLDLPAYSVVPQSITLRCSLIVEILGLICLHISLVYFTYMPQISSTKYVPSVTMHCNFSSVSVATCQQIEDVVSTVTLGCTEILKSRFI
jgi:uncharacterized membrane protein